VGTISSYGPTSPGVRDDLAGATAYSRGFLDLRRYNRVSPEGQEGLGAFLDKRKPRWCN
jgi:hypothetical protein